VQARESSERQEADVEIQPPRKLMWLIETIASQGGLSRENGQGSYLGWEDSTRRRATGATALAAAVQGVNY
jgi:hypothetical protein